MAQMKDLPHSSGERFFVFAAFSFKAKEFFKDEGDY
jgi:hypothetical protein